MPVSMRVRIVEVPPGEAPEHIRRAWVGLVLPVEHGENGPRKVMTSGVLSGPRGWLTTVLALVRRRLRETKGYLVAGSRAVAILERLDPHAAAWWRAHAPHLVDQRGYLVFQEHVCELVDEAVETPGADAAERPNDSDGPFVKDV
jgi:hypothetical protein